MKTLILTSSYDYYSKDCLGNKIAQKIDNKNNFLNTLKNAFIKRNCYVIISGNPTRVNKQDPADIAKKSFELSGIPFKEYIYVDDTNKDKIAEYVKRADCIDLCGGHLPKCNAFIQELNLREHIKNFDGVIIGTSGGAMNMADTVYCIPEIEGEHADNSFNRYLKGLDLININIIPHYQYFKTVQFSDGVELVKDVIMPDSINNEMIALVDGSYIVKQDQQTTIYGEAYKLKGKEEKLCDNGEIVRIS